jgi:uncharacterized ferredoxin-like protein
MKIENLDREAVLQVAHFMCLSARTAPKARGRDNIFTAIIDSDDEKENIAKKMEEIAQLEPEKAGVMLRDAQSLRKSVCVVLIGTRVDVLGLNCGFCGYRSCAELQKTSGRCAYVPGDLGIAIGSAVSTASLYHVDNRVMYSIGYAVLRMNILPEDVKIVYGIPLSATGKNIYFDRVK